MKIVNKYNKIQNKIMKLMTFKMIKYIKLIMVSKIIIKTIKMKI